MFTISLIDIQIPQNAGNIARLCAGSKMHLHLVGDLGFRLTNKNFQRAGLDYWQFVTWEYFADKHKYWQRLVQEKFYLFSTKAQQSYHKLPFQKNDYLVFGSETKGLTKTWIEKYQKHCYTIPILEKKIRSYNLANSVAIVAFEGLKQLGQFS